MTSQDHNALSSPLEANEKNLEREETIVGSDGHDQNQLEKKAEWEALARVQDEDFKVNSKFLITFIGLAAFTFLTALDQTIIAPAIPIISNEFKTISDVGWWISAYFMTSTSLQPFYGRLYSFFSLKWVFLSAIIIFEVGSLICAVSNDSKTFIVGRAIAGVGVAGGYIGCLTILAATVPVSKQATYTGLIGASYGAGGIAGPLLGGVFTSSVTWRWCFYINLPIGIPTIFAIVLLFSPPERRNTLTFREKMLKIDWVGTGLILACITCFLLALQWGGIQDPWSASKIIGLFVGKLFISAHPMLPMCSMSKFAGFGVIGIAFLIVQWYMGDNATLPLRLLATRPVGLSSVANFCIGSTYFTLAYFIPIYFQTIKGSSAIHSGIQALPFIVSGVLAVTAAGGFVPIIGFSNPFLITGSVLASVGTGLIYTWKVGTGKSLSCKTCLPLKVVGLDSDKWIAYQVVTGLGIGMSFMVPINVVQSYYSGIPFAYSFRLKIIGLEFTWIGTADVEVVTAITVFFQTLGGCFFNSICQSIYQNYLLNNLIAAVPPSEVAPIIQNGLSAFRQFVSPDLLPTVVQAAMDALNKAFIPPIALSVCMAAVAVLLPWNSVKGQRMAMAAA
ncbi:putative MFS toxin efflux pump [Atractiella rhizophila]|nr:putative MFS toxin efflux pump [Atractiella rhizophila]